MRFRWTAVAALLVLLVNSGAYAQVPEKYENLKVLPKDISRDQLTQIMRAFSNGLGVRCSYCHIQKPGAQGDGLDSYDFASDKKGEKDVARAMMRMVRTINDTLLANIPERADPPVRVQCVTCHRGSPLPRTLDAVLAATIEKAGVDSAVAEYRRLREQMHLGRYNFAESSLSQLAQQLAADNKTDAAIRMLSLNQEFFPKSANIDFQLGEVYRGRGEKDKAIASYRRALEKAPDHEQAKRRLKELAAS